MDRIVDPDARAALVEEVREAATRLREVGEEEEVLDTSDDSVRSAVRTDVAIPEPPFWGVREIEVDRDELYTHLDTHVLFKLHWGGRGVKGEEWRKLLEEDFRPRLERMWREADYLHPRALLGYFPCYSEGNDIVVLDPADRETVIERFTCPRQPKGDRLCLADFFRPEGHRRARRRRPAGGHRRLRGHRADGQARGRRRVRRAALRPRARRADRRGPGRVAALARAQRPRDRRPPGPPLLVGLPGGARPVRAPQGRAAAGLAQIGMEISDGYAPIPEQSTLALVCHHPQAGYYGMRNGRLLPDGSPDDVIRGTPRDPSTFADAEALAGSRASPMRSPADIVDPRPARALRGHQPGPALGRGRPPLRAPRQPLLPRAPRRGLHAPRAAPDRGRRRSRSTAPASPTSPPAPAARPTSSPSTSSAPAPRTSTRWSEPPSRASSRCSASPPTGSPSSAARPRSASRPTRSAAAPSGSSPTRAASTPTTSPPTSRASTPRRANTRSHYGRAPPLRAPTAAARCCSFGAPLADRDPGPSSGR